MNLKKMLVMWLTNNQIEKIPSDTFDDLTSLVELQLSKKFHKFHELLSNFFYRWQQDKIHEQSGF